MSVAAGVVAPLSSVEATVSGPPLAVQTCARRLAALGAWPELSLTAPGGRELTMRWRQNGGNGHTEVRGRLSWYGPAPLGPEALATEAIIQARCGLMEVHGREQSKPRRIGLEAASVAAGLLAAQGVLAGLIGGLRGRPVNDAHTSVLQAGLVLASHHVAIATCPSEPRPAGGGDGPGPPFPTADGRWVELETLDPERWRSFWVELGANAGDLGRAWTSFRRRYERAVCSLPTGLHDATARRSLADLVAAAGRAGVSLVPVRGYPEVLVEWTPSSAWPIATPTSTPLETGRHPGMKSNAEHHDPGSGPLPLEGLRVVEATNRIQGPLGGQLLRMLGAEVVLVEPPGGDPARIVGPYAGETGAFFGCFNRGKASVQLDLSSTAGRAALLDLVADTDVFIHNWRPGKAAAWGLEADDLAQCNPGLVYVEASGWGSVPKRCQLVGTEFMVQAYAGIGGALNPEGTLPFPSRVLLVDYLAGFLVCEAALAGLYRRERGGRGWRVHTSLLTAAMAFQAHVLEDLAAGQEQRRRGGRPVWDVLDQPLAAADGTVVVDIDDEIGYARLCRALDVDPGPDRASSDKRLVERIATRRAQDVEELALAVGVPGAVASTNLVELATDPRLSHLFERIGGTCLVPASPWRFEPPAGRPAQDGRG